MNLFEKTGILPKAGMLLRHQSGYESRLVRDWGRVPEHWDAVVEDRATQLILLDEARLQGLMDPVKRLNTLGVLAE